MSTFDTLEVGRKNGQVKLFLFDGEMRTFKKGDAVPLPGDYSIAMREGGYANVTDGRLRSWTKEPLYPAMVYDKWGSLFDPEHSKGILGEDYLQ